MHILSLIMWYIFCGVLAYGFSFGYFQNQFSALAKDDYFVDHVSAFLISIWGPISLLGIIVLKMYKYGLKWR